MLSMILKAIRKSTGKVKSYIEMVKDLSNDFSRIGYDKSTEDCNYCERKRKFDLFIYAKIAIRLYYNNVKNITQDLMCNLYNMETNNNITVQAIAKQLKKDDTLKAIANFANMIISESINFGIQDTYIKKLLALLNKKIGVTSLIGTDGTCLNVMPGCTNTLGASSMGNAKKDGTAGSVCIKAHICQDICNDILSVALTGTAGKGVGERNQVNAMDYTGTLAVFDAGYQSEELMSAIAMNGGYFIVKIQNKTTGTILSVNSDTYNNKSVQLKTRELKHVNPRIGEVIDVNVKLSGGTQARVIRYGINSNSSRRSNKKRRNKTIITILTNIKSENISYKTIINIYRLRWRICEIGNKCMKSGDNFQAITSHNANIVSEFICFSLIAFTLKNLEAKILTQICREKKIFTNELKTKIISPLKMHKNSYFIMHEATDSLFYSQDKFMKNIVDIASHKYKYFLLNAPSNEDKEHLRNIYCVIDEIIKTEEMAA